jgi:hypothetical protein
MSYMAEVTIALKGDHGIKPSQITGQNPQAKSLTKHVCHTFGNMIRSFEVHGGELDGEGLHGGELDGEGHVHGNSISSNVHCASCYTCHPTSHTKSFGGLM